MTRKKYVNYKRTFIVDTTDIVDGYYVNVRDFGSDYVFKLPVHVIDNMDYIFSWERYVEERDNKKAAETFRREIERMKSTNSTHLKGYEDMKRFLEEVEDASKQ